MTVKIDGTNGIDTAQLRAPDGDPVAMTVGNDGKVAFPAQGQSLTGDGYIKLPGGLILQWGSNDTGASGRKIIPFPIPFPTKVLSIQCTVVNEAETDVFVIGATIGGYAASLSQFTFGTRSPADVWIGGRFFGWMAIGY